MRISTILSSMAGRVARHRASHALRESLGQALIDLKQQLALIDERYMRCDTVDSPVRCDESGSSISPAWLSSLP